MIDRSKRRLLTGVFGASALASGGLLTAVASLGTASHAKDVWDMLNHKPSSEVKLHGDITEMIEPDAAMVAESAGKTVVGAFLVALSAYAARGGYWMLGKSIKDEPLIDGLGSKSFTRRDVLNLRRD